MCCWQVTSEDIEAPTPEVAKYKKFDLPTAGLLQVEVRISPDVGYLRIEPPHFGVLWANSRVIPCSPSKSMPPSGRGQTLRHSCTCLKINGRLASSKRMKSSG
jgi:hypothetical protein